MKQKILILGSTGMLGHQVFYSLVEDQKFEVFDLSFRNKLRSETIICDVSKFEQLSKIIQRLRPDVIINCIGVLIKGSTQNPKNAILLNSYLPHWLADEAFKIDGKLIQISTDCVFSGKKGSYTENDFRDADDVYGRSKALGEVYSDKHLTIRTSIIGPELKENGEGLFHWFMNQDGEANGFTKAFWGGVTTIELSKVILTAINQDLTGLYHVTNDISINKYDLLILFKKYTNKNIKIHEVEGKIVDKSLVDTRKILKRKIPSYSNMIEEMMALIKSRPDLYTNYLIE
jgi:dTDP-4-dehydrorhamnose reductase